MRIHIQVVANVSGHDAAVLTLRATATTALHGRGETADPNSHRMHHTLPPCPNQRACSTLPSSGLTLEGLAAAAAGLRGCTAAAGAVAPAASLLLSDSSSSPLLELPSSAPPPPPLLLLASSALSSLSSSLDSDPLPELPELDELLLSSETETENQWILLLSRPFGSDARLRLISTSLFAVLDGMNFQQECYA